MSTSTTCRSPLRAEAADALDDPPPPARVFGAGRHRAPRRTVRARLRTTAVLAAGMWAATVTVARLGTAVARGLCLWATAVVGRGVARLPAGRPLLRRGTRLPGLVAVGACLLLACCSGGTAPTAVGPPPTAPARVTSTPPLAAAPPVRIRIPAIDVDSTLIGLGLQADGTLQVPSDGSAAGWFTGAPTPGEHGPAVIAAHVDWNHAPGVFYRLRDLEPGDEVAVDRADGSTATFVVLGVEQYPKDAFPTERVYGDIDHAGLRLITCGGSFDRAARSYRDNVVVYAGLVGRAAGPRA